MFSNSSKVNLAFPTHSKILMFAQKNSDTNLPMEKQIGPGIYFTPARPSSSTSTDTHTHKPVDIDLLSYEDLVREKEELERAIAMLQKSNQWMMEEDPDGQDPDLVLAIQENVGWIQLKKARLELIKKRI